RRDEPVRDRLRRPLHPTGPVTWPSDLPTASVVRRRRRPPPWTSLRSSHTEFRTPPLSGPPARAPGPPDDGTADPLMMMYHYDLSRIAYILHMAGAAGFAAELTDHGGELGATLFARLPSAAAGR